MIKKLSYEAQQGILQRLWKRQEKLALNNAQLAKKAGVSHSIISRLKSRTSTLNQDVNFTTFLAIMGALDYRLYIVEIEEDEENDNLFIYTSPN